ncbi:6-cysteine protein liver specific protein 2, putative [Plasmodium vinckei vinckei]|uniref:6-cysteine protein liver specific protein 2, putative n=1 Tax=Plasmodium vinckei vinckei TaxID=54757 RepID=A0A449BR12_PLAVN|nr:6-cysteine protein liver specific protein 2, putative [Plasmodium vinckei vinckei]VEV55874.1 6-cysteine protein liver specific protein 2, putative [Plasmodium vinckei vinckei]
MKGHIKNACFRKTLLITLLLIILKYTKYDYLEKENGEKPKYNNDISPPTLLRTYFDVYVNRKNKDVKELKKLLKNVTISNDYLCTVKKVDINIYNKICGNNVSKIILSTERKYGENDLKKKCISTGSSSCTFGEKKKREALFTNYEKRNVYKNSSLLEDFDENENTNKNFLFELFGIIAKIKKIIIDTSNKIISMCLFITGDHEENLFYIKNNKGYDELQNSNFYDYYENSNIYSINKELYGYNEEYANKYLYSFIDISSDNLNINFYQKVVQGENGNIAPEIFKNKNVDNLSKDKKYDSHSKMNDGNKSNWGVSNGKTETNRNINFKNGQFLKAVSDYFWKKNEKWNESKINQSNKLHKKNDEMIHRLIGRILAENDHEYENLSLNPNRDRERARERENERRQEIEWKRQTDKNKSNYSQAEERLLLIIREQNGTQKSDNPDKNTGVTVLEFSRLPPKKRRRVCTILAETESEISSKDNSNDSKASDNQNNSSNESNDKSKDYGPASPTPGDVAECKINMPSNNIEGKESESASRGDKSNSSGESNDKSKDYGPASPTPGDTAEDKINIPSILIEGKEYEDKSEDKNNDKNKEQHKETNSSDKNNDESKYDNPASSPPAEDTPEGKIKRPSRLFAEKEFEDKNNDKNKEQHKETNSSDKKTDESKYDNPASSPPAEDIPEGKIKRPSRLFAEKEFEDKNNDKNKEQHKETNSSDKNNGESKYDSPASPPPYDAPEGKINRPSRIIAEKESENKNEDKDKDNDKNKEQNKETNSSDKNSDESKEYDPASPPVEDIPEGKINRPSRLIAEKESENKNEDKDKDNDKNKEQNKETNSSDKNSDESKYDSPASPPPYDASEGKINRPSRIIAEKEFENKNEDKDTDNDKNKEQDKESNSSDKNSDESKYDSPTSPPPYDAPEGKIKRLSRLIAEKESENKNEDKNNDKNKEQNKETNSSDKNSDESKEYDPASPPVEDIPEGKINRPSRLIAEKESENKNEDKDKDNDKNKEQNIESNSSDKKNDESKYDSPASPPPYDAPEGKIKRLSRLIAEKESEDNNEGQNKDHDKDQNKESNSSDKNSDESKQDTPASSPAEDIPEGKINRPSRLIAEKESENKSGDSKSSNKETNSSDKSEDKSSDKETNSSDNNNDESKYDSPASPPPYDAPEGKINRPSRLIAEKESENNNEDKNNDKNKEQHKETNSLDNNNGESKEYDPASSPAEDIPEGKINRPSRLIAEKESENKSEDKNNDKNKEQNKESNSSDNNNDESKHDSPSSPPPYDAPEGKINRPSRLIAEKELENKENIRYAKQYKPYTSSNNHIDVSKYYNIVSSPPTDAPEDKKNTPPRLLTEKESENKSEDKNNDKNKEQNKESNSSDKNSDESKQDTPASPPAEDIPEGKINRPSRLIAEKESENKNEDKDKDNNKNEEQNKESNSSDNNNDESKHDSPSSPPAEDIPEGKINRPSRLIAEKELEYKDNEHDKEQFSKKNEINRKKNASYKSMVAENGQKDNEDEEMKAVFEKIKKKKEKEKIKYYPYDIIETMEALSSLSNEEYYMNDGAASRAKTSSILGKYLRQTNASNKHLDINMFFDEKPYRYRKGNYYFINPFPYSIIKMKKNEGLGYSEKIKYDGVYCYSLSFNNNSSLTYEIENSFRNVKPIEEIVPGTLTGFKSDDGYQKMLTPMFVEEDMFLHCAFNNEPNEIENRIASFPVKIFLKKNLNKTKGCSFQINMHDSIYKEYAERESFLSKKIILNDENSSNECAITATNEIIGFQCGPPYNHYTNNNNTSYMDKFFFNYVNNEDIKGGEYFKVEPAHCFEEVNTNEDIENVAPGSFPFPNFEMINGGLKSHHTRYLKLNIRDPNTAISCYCNYYNNGKIIYSGIMTINGKQNYNGLSDSIYSDQDTNKENDNAKQTGRKKNKPNEKNKINKMEKYDYKYFLNLLSYYNPYFMLYRKQPEDVKNDFIYDSKNNNQNNDEFLKKIQNKLTNLKFSDNDKHIHGMDDNLRYKYDNRHSNVYPISDYDSESHFDSERLSDSYEDTFNDDYISPNSNSYYDENTYNPDDLFSNYDDVNIESEYEELDPLQDNVTFQDNKSYEDKTQSIIVINKSKNVNVYIPKNKIKNKSKHIKNIEDIEDKKTKDALLKYLLLTYEETPDKNENLNTKLELFKEYFPSSSKNNILIEEKENDNTSNKIKNTSDIKEESIEPLNEKQINSEIEVSENDFTLDHNKSYNHDNANSNNHEEGITHGKINDDIPIAIMNTILHGLFGHNEYDGNKEENPKKDKKLHQTKNNTIENEDEEDLIKKSEELTEDENTFQKIK